jgi:hypothetical protein
MRTLLCSSTNVHKTQIILSILHGLEDIYPSVPLLPLSYATLRKVLSNTCYLRGPFTSRDLRFWHQVSNAARFLSQLELLTTLCQSLVLLY